MNWGIYDTYRIMSGLAHLFVIVEPLSAEEIDTIRRKTEETDIQEAEFEVVETKPLTPPSQKIIIVPAIAEDWRLPE